MKTKTNLPTTAEAARNKGQAICQAQLPSSALNFEQQIIADMARARVKLAKDFAAVGELSMARFNFQSAIEKLEMAESVGEQHAVLDESIALIKEEISKLGTPDHGQKGTSSLLEIETKKT